VRGLLGTGTGGHRLVDVSVPHPLYSRSLIREVLRFFTGTVPDAFQLHLIEQIAIAAGNYSAPGALFQTNLIGYYTQVPAGVCVIIYACVMLKLADRWRRRTRTNEPV
jgi:hypothetical protein